MKTLSCLALFMTVLALLAATTRLYIEVDSDFNKPYGTAWWLNKGVSGKDAKASIVKDEQSNGKCLKIEVPEGQKNASVVSETQFLFIPDGTVEMEVKLKGKGLFTFNFYCYDSNGKYLGIHGTSKKTTVDSTDWQRFTDSISMARFPKETSRIRAVLSLIGDGTIYIDDAVYHIQK